MKQSFYSVAALCLTAMVVALSCDPKENTPPPDLPAPIAENETHYIATLKQTRSFSDGSAPITTNYSITYTEPDSGGNRIFSEVRVVRNEGDAENAYTYSYAYDDTGNLAVTTAFDGDPETLYSCILKFNSDGSLKQLNLLKDKKYYYYYYDYNRKKQLVSALLYGSRFKIGFWDLQWSEGNITKMAVALESTATEQAPGEVKVEGIYDDALNNYSVDLNGLLEYFAHHSFDPVMPVFPSIACKNLLTGLTADIQEMVAYGDQYYYYTRYLEGNVSVEYEKDAEDRVAKMTVIKTCKAVNKPDWIEEEVYNDLPAYFNYTDVFEFTYL